MKKISKALLISSAVIAMTGCSASSGKTEQVMDAQKEFGCSTINVYNAGEYISESAIPDFEKAFNATVKYDVFESNEIMYTKLMGGSAYDVLVPSDYMIERLMSEGMLQKLNQEQLTNLDQISDDVIGMRNVFDPAGEYAVPYFWGSVGLVYNKNNVDPAVIEEKGWDILLDSTYAGRVYAYDSQRDMFMVALKALGYSMNTSDTDEINAAYEWLLSMNKAITPAYVTDEVIDGMINGNMDIAIMYSGDAAYVLTENEDMAWVEPKQGTNIWIDAMVIPSNSACPALANEFINFMVDYDQQYANSEEIGYSTPNKKAAEELSAGTYEGISAYSPRTGYEKDEVFHFNPEMTKKLSDLWTRVKMSIN